MTLMPSSQAETIQICSYSVSFELPTRHENKTNSNAELCNEETNDPDIYWINVFTTGSDNYIAPFTLRKFDDPQDASRDAMERELEDILIHFGAAEHTIALDDGAIDQCYSIKGTAHNNMGVNWTGIYYWMDRYWDPSQHRWLGWTSCAVISSYPNSEDFLDRVHIVNLTPN